MNMLPTLLVNNGAGGVIARGVFLILIRNFLSYFIMEPPGAMSDNESSWMERNPVVPIF